MLRLEKAGNSTQLTLRVREHEAVFNPILLRALAYALALHFGAFLFFHVTPTSPPSTFQYPPVQVESEAPYLEVAAITTVVWSKDFIPPPPIPTLPTMELTSFLSELPLKPSTEWEPLSLQGLEEQVWPEWETPLSIPLEEPRIRLSISGDLAEVPLNKGDPLLEEMQPISLHSNPAYVSFQVLLDKQTGEIFWFERTSSSGREEVDREGERILLNLRFTPQPAHREPIQGVLDFVFL